MTALHLPRLPRSARPRPERVARPQLRVVAPPSQLRVGWVVGAIVVVALAVFAAVTLNALAADEAVHAATLEHRVRQAEVDHGQLLTEVASLESPARIAAAAEELGLVRVDHPRQLRVDRLLAADGVVHDEAVVGRGTDVLKPLLARD